MPRLATSRLPPACCRPFVLLLRYVGWVVACLAALPTLPPALLPPPSPSLTLAGRCYVGLRFDCLPCLAALPGYDSGRYGPCCPRLPYLPTLPAVAAALPACPGGGSALQPHPRLACLAPATRASPPRARLLLCQHSAPCLCCLAYLAAPYRRASYPTPCFPFAAAALLRFNLRLLNLLGRTRLRPPLPYPGVTG